MKAVTIIFALIVVSTNQKFTREGSGFILEDKLQGEEMTQKGIDDYVENDKK